MLVRHFAVKFLELRTTITSVHSRRATLHEVPLYLEENHNRNEKIDIDKVMENDEDHVQTDKEKYDEL